MSETKRVGSAAESKPPAEAKPSDASQLRLATRTVYDDGCCCPEQVHSGKETYECPFWVIATRERLRELIESKRIAVVNALTRKGHLIAYTLGCSAVLPGCPELCIVGLQPESGKRCLHGVFDHMLDRQGVQGASKLEWKDGMTLKQADSGLLLDTVLRSVDLQTMIKNGALAFQGPSLFHLSEQVQVVQLLWPDIKGLYPKVQLGKQMLS
jgi:hypothetical protein